MKSFNAFNSFFNRSFSSDSLFTYIKNNSISQYSVLPIQEIGGKTYHCQGIVDKLNKLSDENERLKKELKALNDFIELEP